MFTRNTSIARTASSRLLALLTLVVICAGALPASSASASHLFDGRYSLKVKNTTTYQGRNYRSRDAGSFILDGSLLSGRTYGRDGMVDYFALRLTRSPGQYRSQYIYGTGRVIVVDSRGRRSYGTIAARLRFRVLRSGRIKITGPYFIRITSGQYPGAILRGNYSARK